MKIFTDKGEVIEFDAQFAREEIHSCEIEMNAKGEFKITCKSYSATPQEAVFQTSDMFIKAFAKVEEFKATRDKALQKTKAD